MILTDYLIDVLFSLSWLLSCLSLLVCTVALLSAFEESSKSRPSKEKLYFVFLLHSFAWLYSLSCRMRKLFATLLRDDGNEREKMRKLRKMVCTVPIDI